MSKQKSKPRPTLLIPAMDADEFNGAVAKLGFAKGGLAKLLGCDPRTERRWRSGESPIPADTALALRLMVRFEVKPPAQCLA
jgi:hypothetical protein